MPDWDADSQRLHANLKRVLATVRDDARTRKRPSLGIARKWHQTMMSGLTPEPPADRVWFGYFRGEAEQEGIGVRIGPHEGTHPSLVSTELERFEDRLQASVDFLDEQLPAGTECDAETLEMILLLMSWVHNEWVRIHPFANGNGRTARIWANWVAMRYGLPPIVRLRPRPEGDSYAKAANAAMSGHADAMVPVFREMLLTFPTDWQPDEDE